MVVFIKKPLVTAMGDDKGQRTSKVHINAMRKSCQEGFSAIIINTSDADCFLFKVTEMFFPFLTAVIVCRNCLLGKGIGVLLEEKPRK